MSCSTDTPQQCHTTRGNNPPYQYLFPYCYWVKEVKGFPTCLIKLPQNKFFFNRGRFYNNNQQRLEDHKEILEYNEKKEYRNKVGKNWITATGIFNDYDTYRMIYPPNVGIGRLGEKEYIRDRHKTGKKWTVTYRYNKITKETEVLSATEV